MSTEPKPPLKRPPSPQNWKRFDSWNSASTGHQIARAEYSGSGSWRETRSLKLRRQLQIGDCLREEDHTNSARLAFDGICASQDDRDEGLEIQGQGQPEGNFKDKSVEGPGEWRWVTDAEAKRAQMGVRDIRSFMGVGKRKSGDELLRTEKKNVTTTANNHIHQSDTRDGRDETKRTSMPNSKPGALSETERVSSSLKSSVKPQAVLDDQISSISTSTSTAPSTSPSTTKHARKIFAGVTIFVNGSTLPQISDHKLKQLLVQHGAHVSIFMARKTVSHMIVGQPNTGTEAGFGAGGGLSARKLQQEIARGGWKGVKIISVEWALESIKAGKRLAESRFAVLNVAQKGQMSVAGMFGSR